MLRRALFLRCAAGAGADARARSGGAGPFFEGMPLADAYTMFGFNMNEPLTEKEIKKRYIVLAKLHHPDRKGGSRESFLKLKTAHKLLQQNKHEVPEGRATTFTRESRGTAMNRVDTSNIDTDGGVDVSDAFAVLLVFPLLLAWYYLHNARNVERLSDARSRMTADEVRPQKPVALPKHEWHPWKASSQEKAQIAEIVEDRKTRLNIPDDVPYTPQRRVAAAPAAMIAAARADAAMAGGPAIPVQPFSEFTGCGLIK